MRKVYEAGGEAVRYYHWGDLDYGGMQIFNHLRTCWPGLQPSRMDLAAYEDYLEFGEEFDDPYAGKLESLLNREEFALFHELIRARTARGFTAPWPEQYGLPQKKFLPAVL